MVIPCHISICGIMYVVILMVNNIVIYQHTWDPTYGYSRAILAYVESYNGYTHG